MENHYHLAWTESPEDLNASQMAWAATASLMVGTLTPARRLVSARVETKNLVDQAETLTWLSLGLKNAAKETTVCFYLFMLVPGTT